MDLSIIILNYKTLGLVKNCLKAIKGLSLPFNYEVIVVDNNSSDGSVEYLKNNYFDIKLIEARHNLGFSGGNNLAIKSAQGKYLLILNPDILILDQAIEKMIEFMDNHPSAGICGPKLLNPDGTLQYSCSRFPDWRLPFYRRTFLARTKKGQKWVDYYLMKDWDHQSNQKVDWFYGACLMVRKEFIKEVGLLDERYFMYIEDLDWCRRFWQKNYEVWYVAEAEVIHYHQRDSAVAAGFGGILKKSGRIHLQSWLKYYFKYRKKQLPR
ncbi:glycosyltransferase family 2 protein [Patescibacteria group bacterium]|nr:glycosyltransferase family 2 protein [Patescibacteria group bacterium]